VKIQDESYSINASEQSFVGIDYSATVYMSDGPNPDNASVWFERTNLPWVVRALRDIINVYGLPAQRIQSGGDSLRVNESGPEPAPFIGIYNKRPSDAPHGGAQLVQLTKPLAERLLAELEQL
jgi:hypothetical protein